VNGDGGGGWLSGGCFRRGRYEIRFWRHSARVKELASSGIQGLKNDWSSRSVMHVVYSKLIAITWNTVGVRFR